MSPRAAAKKKKTPPVKRNAVGETPLHQAAKRGDAARVRELLRQGADPNVPDHAGGIQIFCLQNNISEIVPVAPCCFLYYPALSQIFASKNLFIFVAVPEHNPDKY